MKNQIKIRSLLIMAILMMNVTALFAQAQTEKFKVFGNCGMCETRIEKAAKAVDGVSAADWDKDTKMLEVTFSSSTTNVHKIHMAVANVGHDTEMHKAKDEVYNELPACCKYERKAAEQQKQSQN
ncbi:heavy-metal-associated domain-containing protein [Bacteroidota bacterium]